MADLDKLPFEEYCKTIFNKDTLVEKPESLKGYRGLSCTQYILGPALPPTWASWARR